jgi:Flp pilus assembly protein TadG
VTTLKSFIVNRSGAFANVFAIALPVMMTLIGGSIDYASIARQRTDLQAIADAAAVAVARQMTMQTLSDKQIQSIAYNFALANAENGGLSGLRLSAKRIRNGGGAQVSVSANAHTPLGLLSRFDKLNQLSASASARIGNEQTKLCLLTVTEARGGAGAGSGVQRFVSEYTTGIVLGKEARITAPDCVLHTNFRHPEAFLIEEDAVVTANLLCAVGGITNKGGTVQGVSISDCPKIENPMESIIHPRLQSALGPKGHDCRGVTYKDIVLTEGTHTLSPGNYCGNITIKGTARVTLEPGVYAIQGVLTVSEHAHFVGERVGIYLWGGHANRGRPSYFRFLDHALISLSAPETGPMAGMLIWEGVNGAIIDKLLKVADHNFHQISSTRANRLTGTIYLPGGRLLINSPVEVAEDSDFTVLLVSRLELQKGPNLVLNADYANSRVPVPKGLGAIGSKTIHLEN